MKLLFIFIGFLVGSIFESVLNHFRKPMGCLRIDTTSNPPGFVIELYRNPYDIKFHRKVIFDVDPQANLNFKDRE